MYRRLVQSPCLLLVLGLVSTAVADESMYWRFVAATEWAPSGPLCSTEPDPNEVQPIETRPEPTPVQYPGLRRNAFAIGPEVYHFEYEEPGTMKDQGTFWGLAGSYTYRHWVPASPEDSPSVDKYVFRAEGRLARGEVDYEGSLMDGTPYTINGIDDFVFEGRLLLGPEWLGSNMLSTLYAGIGYRYLNDDSSSDPAGYERESNYYYIPIGCEINTHLRAGWFLAGRGEFDYFLWGLQRSHVNPIVENRQNSGSGYRASIKLQKKSKDVMFVIEPFFRYWDIDKSEVEPGGWEPANNTTEVGISVLLML